MIPLINDILDYSRFEAHEEQHTTPPSFHNPATLPAMDEKFVECVANKLLQYLTV